MFTFAQSLSQSIETVCYCDLFDSLYLIDCRYKIFALLRGAFK